ncbi:hypothetical protein [Amycolatopsis sp. NPDC051903]|uniref:hypothetical protein n=1 Tax=Amycolatopsis sp. NPDC051903 TaxID=3363936 RepID=UPI0037980DEC
MRDQITALALAQAAELPARTGDGAPGGWLHGLRLAEQDALAVRLEARGGAAPAACLPSAEVITAADGLLKLAERRLVEGRSLLDVAAAAEAVRSAVVTARVAIEARLTGVPGDELPAVLPAVASVDGLAERASLITEAVRSEAAVA